MTKPLPGWHSLATMPDSPSLPLAAARLRAFPDARDQLHDDERGAIAALLERTTELLRRVQCSGTLHGYPVCPECLSTTHTAKCELAQLIGAPRG